MKSTVLDTAKTCHAVPMRFKPRFPGRILYVKGVTKEFGGLRAIDEVTLDISPGGVTAIIGPNGAGKTTLFHLISGLYQPDHGEIWYGDDRISDYSPDRIAALGIARTFQHSRVFRNMTVLENGLVGAHTHFLKTLALGEHRARGAALLRPFLEVINALFAPDGVKREHDEVMTAVRDILGVFGDRLLPREHHFAYSLSYANRRRTELARAMAMRPSLLLLDEPTAGMNPTETVELMGVIRDLAACGVTVLLIEHKIDFVSEVSQRVVVMDYGSVIASGKAEEVCQDEHVIEAYLGRATNE